MTLEQCYEKLNGSYAEAKSRLMSDRLVEKFMLKFLTEPTMGQLRDAIKAENHEETFRSVHTLKGVAANLSFTELYNSASDLTEQLRGNEELADPQLVEKVEASYKKVIDTITAYQNEM